MYYQTFILFLKYKKELIMGKGDIKSKRGKIFNKSYGVRRPKKKKKHNTNISNKRCVYCGVSLLKRSETAKFQAKNKYYPDNGATRDHVPQQCLFEGYSDNLKKNRFVVPCCHKCNLEFSKNEQELRNLIGIANENDEMQDAITQSAVKSILSKKDYEKELFIDIHGNVKGVEFDLDKLSPNHIKNFKGVYYKKYEKVFPKGFDVHVVDMKLSSNFEERALDFLNRNSEWQYSGHKDIFKYRIELGKIGSDSTLVKTNDIKQAIIVLCHLCYHKRFDILVIANKKQLGYIKK